MSSGQRSVLFFGSVSGTLVGHEVRGHTLAAELEKLKVSLQLRVTATAANRRAEEVLGAVGSSAGFSVQAPPPLSSATATADEEDVEAALYPLAPRNALFLPVMLELAQDLAAGDGAADGLDSDSDADDEATGVPSAADATAAAAAAASAEAKNRKAASTKSVGSPASRKGTTTTTTDGQSTAPPPSGPGYTGLTVTVCADAVSGGGSRSVVVRSRQVLLPSLNKAAARDTCVVVRLAISSRLLARSTTATAFASAEVERDVSDADAATVLYVLLRVVDLSGRVCAAEDSVDGLQRLLGLPPPMPKLGLQLARRVSAPYGVMPLTELYRHYCLFYSRHYSKVLRPSKEVVRMLAAAAPGLVAADASYPYRWNALTEVRLDRVLLGEEAFAPLLLTLAHCDNLRELASDHNALGDTTCARLCALLSRHRYLRALSVAHNPIYEGGADQLLRLARRNHRLADLSVDGCWCSDATRQRIAAVTAASRAAIAQDPLNAFSARYGYLTSPASISPPTLKLALTVWAMLSVAPVGDVDVWVRNSTTRDMDQYVPTYDAIAVEPRRRACREAARAPLSVIPLAARAPLLSEVMRTVYVGVCMAAPDPLVRSVFVDLEGARQKRLALLQDRADARPPAKDGNDDSKDDKDDASSVDSLDGTDRRPRSGKSSMSGSVVLGAGLPDGDIPAEIAKALRLGKYGAAGGASNASTPKQGGSGSGGGPTTKEPLRDMAQALAAAEDDIYNTSFLKIVVATMRGIASESPWEEVAVMLRGIGAVHRSMGVRSEDYWLATHILVKSLGVCLGVEEFTSDRLAAFLMTVTLGLRTATAVDGVVEPL